MGSHEVVLIFFSIIAVVAALGMLLFKNPVSVALSLLAVLLSTAAIYGVIGEHLVATLQLVIYAGAIMVLFVFSIMLLNLGTQLSKDMRHFSFQSIAIVPLLLLIFVALSTALYQFVNSPDASYQWGHWTPQKIAEMGGQTWCLSIEVFTKNFLAFEVVGLILLLATAGAVVLAKRKL